MRWINPVLRLLISGCALIIAFLTVSCSDHQTSPNERVSGLTDYAFTVGPAEGNWLHFASVATGALLNSIPSPLARIDDLCFSSDGNRLFLLADGGSEQLGTLLFAVAPESGAVLAQTSFPERTGTAGASIEPDGEVMLLTLGTVVRLLRSSDLGELYSRQFTTPIAGGVMHSGEARAYVLVEMNRLLVIDFSDFGVKDSLIELEPDPIQWQGADPIVSADGTLLAHLALGGHLSTSLQVRSTEDYSLLREIPLTGVFHLVADRKLNFAYLYPPPDYRAQAVPGSSTFLMADLSNGQLLPLLQPADFTPHFLGIGNVETTPDGRYALLAGGLGIDDQIVAGVLKYDLANRELDTVFTRYIEAANLGIDPVPLGTRAAKGARN